MELRRAATAAETTGQRQGSEQVQDGVERSGSSTVTLSMRRGSLPRFGLQGCSLMMVCSTECSASARVCCRSCAARRPRRRSQTRQRRGAAPETALSSAVSSQAQRHQVWCKTPRATGSPPPTPPTLRTIRADVRDEDKNRAGWQKTGAHHMINSLGALPPQPHSSQNNTKMTAGCCDTDSPWLSWSYWFEPLYTRARKRTIEEQEMIEACTTPRSGRTSFDE